MKSISLPLALVKPYWKRSLCALGMLAALVATDLSIPRLIQRLIDRGIFPSDQAEVISTGILMLIISVSGTVFAVGNNIFSVRVGESVARDLRRKLFRKIQSLSSRELANTGTGQLMVRLTSDTAAIQRLTQVSLRIGTRAPLMMLGSLILMIRTSPGLALSMLPLLVVTSAMIVLFVPRMEPLFGKVQARLDRLNTVLHENIAGVRLVRAFVRNDLEDGRFDSANAAFASDSAGVMRFMALLSPLLTVFVNVGMVLVIWTGGLDAIRGGITAGQLVAFSNYLVSTMTPLVMMTNLSNVWANGLASSRRILTVLDEEPSVVDRPGAREVEGGAAGRIVLEGVSYRYPGSPVDAVTDVNLEIEPGSTIGFLGATGSGKTTLIGLIPRFYDPTAGRLLLDGSDLRDCVLASIRRFVAVVPQESTLFSGSVLYNVVFGRPSATLEEAREAARIACALEFIEELPQGWETRVEERGVNLSGGQKQRIAIARAVLARPRVLILDDSTSSVDVETEASIQNRLASSLPGCTRIVVAQRISSVLSADRIVLLDEGRVAAVGSHSSLLADSPLYKEIYDSQLGDDVVGGIQ
ncbi:MAG TPA: ABC transporter ATP-binding protein [Candidatus Fermentibacter daniensis]|nr:ABC transporter ATP-binding protein [Candidatus Fermentibacter daniensis]